MTDWAAFDRALASRRRDMVDGFMGFLRRNTVSQHSPNEHLRLDHLFQGARTTAGLLLDLAAIPG